MKTVALLPFIALVLGLSACQSDNRRIGEHAAEFAALDARTQANIRRGVVEPGYTTDMVYMALGRPAATTTTATGDVVWSYRVEPVTAYNETIQDGYRRRVVYDPAKQTEEVIVEPIDAKAFPQLVPHTLRLTFHDGKLTKIERINRW